jgi:hypothetical protein
MDLGADDVTVVGLAHDQVSVGMGSDLGQVGDDDDLAVPGELRQASPDGEGGAATDTRVDLVEDEGRRPWDRLRDGHLDGEHDPGEFTAGGRSGNGAQRAAGV